MKSNRKSALIRAACALLSAFLLCSVKAGAEPARVFTVQPEHSLQFLALAVMDFNLRETPQDQGRKIHQVREGDRVEVLSLGETWSLLRHKGTQGHGKTRWLKAFHAQQPGLIPPGYPQQQGVASMIKEVHLSVPGYGGNALKAGQLVAIRHRGDTTSQVDMMRKLASLENDTYVWLPFARPQDAQPGDLLNAFTTFYNHRAAGGLMKGRWMNIHLAAGLLDQRVLAPGERFSFNREIGPYNRSRGYEKAPIIGGNGEGVGGGVCQLSTTLHIAALGLPIQVADWSLHSQAGVAYAPRYFDASVGAYSDLALTNALPYPIRIAALPQDGVLTVMIYRAD